jgi:serine/threonine protein kinase
MKNDSLGQGAYASVYTCVSIETGVEYAVKLVNVSNYMQYSKHNIVNTKICRSMNQVTPEAAFYEK